MMREASVCPPVLGVVQSRDPCASQLLASWPSWAGLLARQKRLRTGAKDEMASEWTSLN